MINRDNLLSYPYIPFKDSDDDDGEADQKNGCLPDAKDCNKDVYLRYPLVMMTDANMISHPDLINGYVTLCHPDLKILENDSSMINDAVVDFYLRVLATDAHEDLKNKMKVLGSNFYKHLINSSTPYTDIKRWTKKYNLFEQELIIIPIIMDNHWSLVVIIKPGLLLETTEKSYLLHFDSLQYYHNSSEICPNLRLFLQRLASDNGNNINVDEDTCPCINVTVPQQQGGIVCGLYLIEFVKRVMKQWPLPQEINIAYTKVCQSDLYNSYFDNLMASKLRRDILKVAVKLKPLYDQLKNEELIYNTEFGIVEDSYISEGNDLILILYLKYFQHKFTNHYCSYLYRYH